MPHNIFLHSALVQSRKIDLSHTGAKQEAILYNAIESGCSLSITVVINIFVMAVFAAGFHNLPDIDKAAVGLSTAGECAAPIQCFCCQNQIKCLSHTWIQKWCF